VHPEHLNTPRLVADAAGTAVWRWDQTEPFGVNVPDENPSSLGAFEFPLRYPGQYADKETNLHYNFFRDYDPGVGRYVESDPIGLDGGINAYSYVDGSPTSLTDPKGLQIRVPRPVFPGMQGPGSSGRSSGSSTGSPEIDDALGQGRSSSSSSSSSSASCPGDDCGKMYGECETANATKNVKIPCFACFQQCQGQGKWPIRIPLWTTIPGNYQRSCAYW
jgi:RHS repeat-associated protein